MLAVFLSILEIALLQLEFLKNSIIELTGDSNRLQIKAVITGVAKPAVNIHNVLFCVAILRICSFVTSSLFLIFLGIPSLSPIILKSSLGLLPVYISYGI